MYQDGKQFDVEDVNMVCTVCGDLNEGYTAHKVKRFRGSQEPVEILLRTWYAHDEAECIKNLVRQIKHLQIDFAELNARLSKIESLQEQAA